MEAGLGSLDPNVFPLDAFNLTGAEGATQRLISLKDPWYLDGERVSYPQTGFVAGRGYWQKHADGTLVQWGVVTITNMTIQNYGIGSYGISYYLAPYVPGNVFNLPIPFIDANYQIVSNETGSGIGSLSNVSSASQFAATAVGLNSANLNVRWVAIGRWKA